MLMANFSKGERVSINCTVIGSPTSTILWRRNEEIIFDGGRHKIHKAEFGTVSKSSLDILALETTDNYATYSCEAENSIGANADKVDIRVIGNYRVSPVIQCLH